MSNEDPGDATSSCQGTCDSLAAEVAKAPRKDVDRISRICQIASPILMTSTDPRVRAVAAAIAAACRVREILRRK